MAQLSITTVTNQILKSVLLRNVDGSLIVENTVVYTTSLHKRLDHQVRYLFHFEALFCALRLLMRLSMPFG